MPNEEFFMMKRIQIMICALIFGLLALTSLQDTAWAEYKPIDVSDIKGEQLRQLSELVESIKKMDFCVSSSGYALLQMGRQSCGASGEVHARIPQKPSS